MQIEAGATGELQITRLNFEPRSGRFEVTLEVSGSEAMRRAPLRLSGIARETYETAAVTRPVARGEILRAGDVVTARRPKAEITGDSITTAEAAIGRAARNALRPGQALRHGDLMKPEVIARNEQIVLFYQAPGLALTARGKALEAGAKGDTINILNEQSKRNVQAVVAGPGRVIVTALSARVASRLAATENGGAGRRAPE